MQTFGFIIGGFFLALAVVLGLLRIQSRTRDGKALLAKLAFYLAGSGVFSLLFPLVGWLLPLSWVAFGLTRVSPYRSLVGAVVPSLTFVVTALVALGTLSVGTGLLIGSWSVVVVLGVVGWFFDGMKTARW